MAVVLQFPERFPEMKPVILSSSPTHIVIAIEVPRAILIRHRRFIEMLLEAAGEQEPQD